MQKQHNPFQPIYVTPTNNSTIKLQAYQVNAIRRERYELGFKLRELAAAYGVSITAIHNICSGKGWGGR